MKKKNKKISIVTTIIIISLFLVTITFLKGELGIILSCKEGKFIDFGSQGMPPMEIVPELACVGYIKIINQKTKEIICENNYSTRTSMDFVVVPCPNLKENKEIDISLEWKTSSEIYGDFNGTENNLMYK